MASDEGSHVERGKREWGCSVELARENLSQRLKNTHQIQLALTWGMQKKWDGNNSESGEDKVLRRGAVNIKCCY